MRREARMQGSWKWTGLATLLVVGIAVGLLVGQPAAQQKNILVSRKATAAPPMEPTLGDAWKNATPLTFKVVGGKNLANGSTDVAMRSLYADDAIYLSVEWKDPTLSARREPWQKQADGSWKMLKDPNDK